MKRHEFKTKLNKTKKQKNAEIGGYTKLIRVDDELFFLCNFVKLGESVSCCCQPSTNVNPGWIMRKKLLNQTFVVRFEKEEENLSDETVLTYQKGNSTCISLASLNSIFITNSGSIHQ